VKKEAREYIEMNSFCTKIEKAIQNNVQPTKCHASIKIPLLVLETKWSLWLPEFSLLIDSPMINDYIVDIHGFGNEQSENIPAAWHSVISVASAEVLGVANAK